MIIKSFYSKGWSKVILLIVFYCLFIVTYQSLSLRSQNHQQIGTFADVINNSNHITPQSIVPAKTSSTSTDASTQTNSSTPKIAAGIIIPIICIGLCFIFCFFCLKCAKNQQQQTQQFLQQTIPCYCGPVKCFGKFFKYIFCVDFFLRCLGIRSTAWERKQQQRLKQEEQRKQKQEKQKLKYQQKYSNQPNVAANPYQTQMRRQQLQPISHWKQVLNKAESQRVKKEKCNICEGKKKQKSNITTACPNHCVFHIQCLIEYKNQNALSKTSNICPHCKSNYFNMAQFYCQKCWNKYSEIQIQSGNVYVSQLDSGEVVKSIGGQKCDQCSKKKWFWQ